MSMVAAGVVPATAQGSSIDGAVRAALDRTTMSVTTFAGNGVIGNADGSNASASFTQPAGLLWNERTKTLFVSDVAGERVRAIKDGVVSTVAGGGAVDPVHLTVAGGYVDGPTGLARFSEPLGMALDPSGALLVADAGNGVIRRVADGRVTTFAGRRGATDGADGSRGTASLHRPLALAYARDGSLYIADFGIGVRRLSSDGTLTTILKAGDVTSVSVGQGARHEVLWFGTFGGVHRYDLETHEENAYGKDESRSSTKALPGSPFQMQAVDDVSVIYSDLANNTVRYLHVPDFYAGAVGSDDSADAADSGALRNGASTDAKDEAPMGVALLPGERIAFADSGDGRIRTISNFSARNFFDYDTSAVPSKRDTSVERIAVVGDSYVFSNTLWNDSIPGFVQNGLDAVAPPPGKRSYIVDAVRLTESDVTTQADFIANYLLGYDAVVFLTTDFTAGAYAALSRADFVAPNYTALSDTLKGTAATLTEAGTSFSVLAVPLAFETAPWARTFSRVENSYFGTRPEDYARLVGAVESSGVRTFDAGPTFNRLQRLPDRRELYSPEDWHLNRAGNIATSGLHRRTVLVKARLRHAAAAAAVAAAILTIPAAASAAAPDKVQGNVILGRVSASALAIWDATDRVAALEGDKKPADEITRTLESESAVAARSMASSVAQAKTITVRITYRRIGAISPAYGTATFQGIERFASVTYPTADLTGKASGYFDALAKGDVPPGVKVDVTGKLPG